MKMNKDEQPIIAFSKNKSETDFINAGELLETLKGDVFNKSPEQAPVVLHPIDEDCDIHLLKLIYKCGNCQTLHLEGGNIDIEDINWNEHSVVYADYSHSPIGYVSRKELIEILEKIKDKNIKVDITTSDDDDKFPLTEIFKCSKHCPSVHLITGWFDKNKN